MKLNSKKLFLYYLLFILTYIGLNFTTSMYLMEYEDFWDESKGNLWSLSSMNYRQHVAYIVWHIPNFPFGLIFGKGIVGLILTSFANPLIVGFSLLRIFKKKNSVFNYTVAINTLILIGVIIIWILLLS